MDALDSQGKGQHNEDVVWDPYRTQQVVVHTRDTKDIITLARQREGLAAALIDNVRLKRMLMEADNRATRAENSLVAVSNRARCAEMELKEEKERNKELYRLLDATVANSAKAIEAVKETRNLGSGEMAQRLAVLEALVQRFTVTPTSLSDVPSPTAAAASLPPLAPPPPPPPPPPARCSASPRPRQRLPNVQVDLKAQLIAELQHKLKARKPITHSTIRNLSASPRSRQRQKGAGSIL